MTGHKLPLLSEGVELAYVFSWACKGHSSRCPALLEVSLLGRSPQCSAWA